MTARGMGSCLLLAGALSVTACGLGRSEPVSTVTIEMVCNTTAECPNGFECILDSEHGPPMRLCESSDPAAVCPVGYETKVLFGQTFCRPPTAFTARPRSSHASPSRHHGGSP
jgi:hypothetical protein